MLGAGTQESPYLISTPQDLNLINNNLGAYYELANDIDMSGYGNFTPIGRAYPFFQGHFNGKGYKISNLSIISTIEYTGFIARTNGGIIENLGLENIYVESNNHHVGGLIGLNSLSERISNCYVTGTVKQTILTKLYAGALAGRNYGTVENCYTDCTVSGGDSVGGFSGVINYAGTTIKNCYSKGAVSGNKNVGAFFGTTDGTVIFENNFYDNQLARVTNATRTGVTGKTTAEMQTQSTYTNWDFVKVWYMNGYPALRIFSDIPTANIETITVNSFTNPLYSKLDKNIKSTKQLNTILESIQTTTEHYTASLRSIEGYLSQINTNAVRNARTVRSGTALVNTFIKPIDSFVHRESQTVKRLISYMKPIQSHIDVLTSSRDIPINVILNTLENDSKASFEQNMSNISYIVNPSFVEVIT